MSLGGHSMSGTSLGRQSTYQRSVSKALKFKTRIEPSGTVMENLQSALFGYFPGKPGDVNLPVGMVSGAPQGTKAKETNTKNKKTHRSRASLPTQSTSGLPW